MSFGLKQPSRLYQAQQNAAEICAMECPDRCRLCKTSLEFQTLRRCRECEKACCERCRLIVDKNRVMCFRCLKLSPSDQKTLMPARERKVRGPTKADLQALDAEIQAWLAAEAKQARTAKRWEKREKRKAKKNKQAKVEALLIETCRECGDPAEPGWGDYCLDCGVEWSYGPGKVGVA